MEKGHLEGVDPLWDYAAQASVELINLHLGSTDPKHLVFQKVQHLLYCVMQQAVREKLHEVVKFSKN